MSDPGFDDELAARVKDAFPEPEVSRPMLPGVRRKVRRRRRRMAGSALAVTAIAAAIVVPLTVDTLDHRSAGPPAWAVTCLEDQLGHRPAGLHPTHEFTGMTRRDFLARASAQKLRVVLIADDGHCVAGVDDLVAGRHVYVAFDSAERVVAAWLTPV